MRDEMLDAGRLPVHTLGAGAAPWWGILGLIAILAGVFGTLISTYFYMRMQALDWPPGGLAPPELLLPTAGLLILIASALPVHRGEKAIARGERARLTMGLLLGAGLAALFLALKVVELIGLEFRWDSHSYGSIFWAANVIYGVAVLSWVLMAAPVAVLAGRGYFDERRRLGVQTTALYVYFLVVVAIPLYGTLYLAPRWLG